MKKYFTFILCWCLLCLNVVQAQPHLPVNANLLTKQWSASWIAHPTASKQDFGVFHFRRSFNLTAIPDSFVVHVTADNRYRLFVNGTPVGLGPARGDKQHWQYETYNLTPFLKAGKNVLAAQVWNLGQSAPAAQMSVETGLLVQGNSEAEAIVNTNSTDWKVIQNEGIKPYPVTSAMVNNQYYAMGACDSMYADKQAWGWEKVDFDDKAWLTAKQSRSAQPVYFAFGYGDSNGGLLPRSIPMMEEKKERIPKIVRATGIKVDAAFLTGKGHLKIPAYTQVTILLDQTYLTTAYPELLVSGGKNSTIDIAYAEALIDKNMNKGNRNDTNDKSLIGYHDAFMPDGGDNRLFRPLWYRTFRFIELKIKTDDDPLILNDFYGMFTAYPFVKQAAFKSNDPALEKIWDVSWHTARLCANETYYDCPYYEQLQYIGDTRIQAPISLYVTGDDRLMRNALEMFQYSKVPEGLSQSRYPSNIPQMIPPFSLYWVDMVHDYHLFRNDPKFVEQFLPDIQDVLLWFEHRLNNDNLLSNVGWWNFVDWAPSFDKGVPPGVSDGQGSSILSLQYVYALDKASELFKFYNKIPEAEHYKQLANQIRTAVYSNCFDAQRQLIADTRNKSTFSQQANAMAILTNTVPADQQAACMQKTLTDKSLTQCSIYYKFYLLQALRKAGMGDQYLENLGVWKRMVSEGLTTFPEEELNTRSDCHAWSASPMIEFLATVCGIEPAEAGFKTVKIEPHLGVLQNVSGKMPHPLGIIDIKLKRSGSKGIDAEITLPPGLTGNFIWNEKVIALKSGKQTIKSKY